MQEVTQIRTHQLKSFMGNIWKFLPLPGTLQVWAFSVNMQMFFDFCAKGFGARAQCSNTCKFFLLALVDDFFYSPTTGKTSPPFATAVLIGMAAVSKIITELACSRRNVIQVGDGYPQKRTFPDQYHTPDTYRR